MGDHRHQPTRQGRTDACICGEALDNADVHTLVPCPNCNGAGRTIHRIPGVPPEVCTRNSPCPYCWPTDENGNRKFWDDNNRAGWITEDHAARIQQELADG